MLSLTGEMIVPDFLQKQPDISRIHSPPYSIPEFFTFLDQTDISLSISIK